MQFKEKRVLVIGLAKSGLSAIKALREEGAVVIVNDNKESDKLGLLVDEVKPLVDEMILGGHPDVVSDYDLVVVSPGVPLDIPFIQKIKAAEIPLIGEIELAYQLCKGSFVGITGTNGKTTTTALTGMMFDVARKDYFVVGNIGTAAVSRAKEAKLETVMVTELSSFQLESIVDFRAKVAAVLNVTPDHLNRHKTMENYIDAKARIFENQTEEDVVVLNYDNELTRALADRVKGQVAFFSRREALESGVYVKDGSIYLNWNRNLQKVCDISDMFIFGDHNVENAMAAIAIAFFSGIEMADIRTALRDFKGVEHRIEYVDTIEDRIFYNDSKGTNVDSTVNAIKSMKTKAVLIAGGMDKGSTYEELFGAFDGKIKALVLLGETKHLIAEEAERQGYSSYCFVENMDEAVERAYKLSIPGDAILLSPACASWDMYENFEKRGEHFKRCVYQLRT